MNFSHSHKYFQIFLIVTVVDPFAFYFQRGSVTHPESIISVDRNKFHNYSLFHDLYNFGINPLSSSQVNQIFQNIRSDSCTVWTLNKKPCRVKVVFFKLIPEGNDPGKKYSNNHFSPFTSHHY